MKMKREDFKPYVDGARTASHVLFYAYSALLVAVVALRLAGFDHDSLVFSSVEGVRRGFLYGWAGATFYLLLVVFLRMDATIARHAEAAELGFKELAETRASVVQLRSDFEESQEGLGSLFDEDDDDGDLDLDLDDDEDEDDDEEDDLDDYIDLDDEDDEDDLDEEDDDDNDDDEDDEDDFWEEGEDDVVVSVPGDSDDDDEPVASVPDRRPDGAFPIRTSY